VFRGADHLITITDLLGPSQASLAGAAAGHA
jgi:hypothetical protein